MAGRQGLWRWALGDPCGSRRSMLQEWCGTLQLGEVNEHAGVVARGRYGRARTICMPSFPRCMPSFPRKRESILISSNRSKSEWITRRSCGAPFGPLATLMFAPASCLRSPAFAGMTTFIWWRTRALCGRGRQSEFARFPPTFKGEVRKGWCCRSFDERVFKR